MSTKKSSGDAPKVKFGSADVHVPSAKFRMREASQATYLQAQEGLREAIAMLGLQDGVSVFVSGFSRELRRHMTVEATQELLHGLAQSMPEVAKFDAPDEEVGKPTRNNPSATIGAFLRGAAFKKGSRKQ